MPTISISSTTTRERSRKTMKNPPHPGYGIRENCLKPLGLNVTQAAQVLGVARHTLSRVVNGHAAISAQMAIRLEKAGWSNAEFWLRRPNHLGSGPGSQGRRSDPGQAIRSANSKIGFCRDGLPGMERPDLLHPFRSGPIGAETGSGYRTVKSILSKRLRSRRLP